MRAAAVRVAPDLLYDPVFCVGRQGPGEAAYLTNPDASWSFPGDQRELPLGFFRLPFAQAHPGPTAIFIDELNARSLEGAAKGQIISRGQGSLGVSHLRTENGVSP